MKKIIIISMVFSLISFCSTGAETVNDTTTTVNEISFQKGLAKNTSDYISNWNKLVSEISGDEDTLNFFSINPDEVKWNSPQQEFLYYQFGNSENAFTSFAINLIVAEDIVTGVEFFSPVVKDDIASQRTKLFFLILIAMADDSLDKDGRESVLSKLGLYDDISTPEQIGSSLTLNGVQYVVEPLIDKGLLVGINFYLNIAD
ncbi:MAG: hypothetical protein O3A49_05240 [Candidatus Marinimicrobia bacterium]|nr:hypothetical protein [Candidatus Neomarinimicrobiota bacterium]MDA1364015.1 hypothetical protein [Candidatus Neomarinimicrobiota bacterium]